MLNSTFSIDTDVLYKDSIISFFQINLRLILVSGKTKEFLFSPNESAADITQYVHEHWPEGKLKSAVEWELKICLVSGQMGHLHSGGLSCMQSSLSNSFEDRAPVDEIYGCPISKWVAETWPRTQAPG